MTVAKMISGLLFFIFLALTGPATAKDLPGESLYQVETKWIDQHGKSVELKSFVGKPVILSMVYLTCTFLCPTVISEIQEIEKHLDEKTNAQTKIVLVSFDPRRDTPSLMRKYLKKRKLDPAKWIFLTNKHEDKIREFAAVIGFNYKKIEKNEFTHSFQINVLNQSGVIVAKVDKANQEKTALIEALKKAAAESPGQ